MLLLFCFAPDKIYYTQATFCCALFVASTVCVCVCVCACGVLCVCVCVFVSA